MVTGFLERVRLEQTWRLIAWSIMVSVIAWTLVYKAGKSDPNIPEFVYVNF
jgi:hypothetical protein